MDLTVPKSDELEVSLFGPGVGECVVVHLGRGEWLIVDSCRDPDDGLPAALKYLKGLDVDLASQVKAVVVTHWHDDHVGGIGELFETCSSAVLVCSQALRAEEFIAFVTMDRPPPVEQSGVSEFRHLFRVLRDRQSARPSTARGPVWATADRTILAASKTSLVPEYSVVALSPSDAAVTLSLHEIHEQIRLDDRRLAPKRRAVARRPNQAAVVLLVQVGNASALLGSDLESRPGSWDGWSGVLQTNAIKAGRSAIFKVAHHGAASGDCPDIWTDHLAPTSMAILTPFLIGNQRLPSEQDIARICSRTEHAFLTSDARWTQPPKRESAVERTIKSIALDRRVRRRSFGQITVRMGSVGQDQPQVTLAGTAHRLPRNQAA